MLNELFCTFMQNKEINIRTLRLTVVSHGQVKKATTTTMSYLHKQQTRTLISAPKN